MTDLKILLRGVLAPEDWEFGTVRYHGWLVTSLVGWANLGDPLDAREMTDRLSETQDEVHAFWPAGVVTGEIQAGVRALLDDRIDDAEKEFQDAKKQDPSEARAAFLTAWAKALPEVWLRHFELKHPDLDWLSLSVAERLDLEDMLAAVTMSDMADRGAVVSMRPTPC